MRLQTWTWAVLFLVLTLSTGHLARAQDQKQISDQVQNERACEAESNNPDTSIEACTRLLQAEVRESSRRQAIALMYRALAWKAKREIERAAGDLTEAINLAPDLAPAREARGDLLRDNDQCDLALPDYDEAIRLLPERPSTLASRALCLIEKNETERAIADLDQVIKLDSNNADGYAVLASSMKARLNIANGNLGTAIADLDEAIKLDPKRAELYADRGTAWAGKDDDKALADLDQAIKLSGNNESGVAVAAWSGKGQIHLQRRDLDAAIADYDEAIKLDPKQGSLYGDRATVWVQKGDDARALSDYDRAIGLEPDNAAFYGVRGDFHRGKGDYERAIADYDRAIERQPEEPTAYGNRGLVRFFQGDFAKAANDLKRVADAEANAYALLLLYLAKVRAGGKRDEARDELTKGAAKFATGEWPQPLVELYLSKRSLDSVSAAATKPEERCEAQFYIGQWHLVRGANAPAKKALQTAADSCPKDFVEYQAAVDELKRR